MIMPSIVRPVRILLRPSALNAIRNVMAGDIRPTVRRGCRRRPVAAAAGTAEPAEEAAGCRRRRRLRRFSAGRDVGDHRRIGLHVAFDQLGRLAIADAETHPHRLELVVDVDPDAAFGLDVGERAEQRVDRRRFGVTVQLTHGSV